MVGLLDLVDGGDLGAAAAPTKATRVLTRGLVARAGLTPKQRRLVQGSVTLGLELVPARAAAPAPAPALPHSPPAQGHTHSRLLAGHGGGGGGAVANGSSALGAEQPQSGPRGGVWPARWDDFEEGFEDEFIPGRISSSRWIDLSRGRPPDLGYSSCV